MYVVANADDDLPAYDYVAEANTLLRAKGLFGRFDAAKLEKAVKEKSGLPVDITAGNNVPK